MSGARPTLETPPDLGALRRAIAGADVYGLARRTDLSPAPHLATTDSRVWLKREDQQGVFSFKVRGAANRLAQLGEVERERGVVAASAGNHAQGVALAARHHGVEATIVMPVTTPPIKVAAVEALGGRVVLWGDTYDDAATHGKALATETEASFIHPFDDPLVVAGGGTVGREILDALPRPAAVYVCCGGGGLLAGVAAWVKWLSPTTEIVAVEAEGAPTLRRALEAGQPVTLGRVDGFADGAAVRRAGDYTFAVARELVDRTILVSNDEISAAVRDIFLSTRTVAEPAGALALAGLLKERRAGTAPAGDLVATLSGANVNFDRLGHIVERAELGAGGEMLLAVTLPETRGAFLRFVDVIGERAVTEFNYRFQDREAAHILVGLKTSDFTERDHLRRCLTEAGFPARDLSEDRLAKRHLRHMVGGRAGGLEGQERFFRVEFPERPGALRGFLRALSNQHNITGFHYRNHGAVEGHVFVGFEVSEGDSSEMALHASLRATGYPVFEETDAPAARMFL